MSGAPMPTMPEVWERTASGLIVPAPKLIVPDRLRAEMDADDHDRDFLRGNGTLGDDRIARARDGRPIRAVDLFAGCGGFSLGMQQAGIDVIAALEWDPHAVTTYLSNLGSVGGCAVAYVSETDKARLAKALKGSGRTTASGWIGEHNPDKSGRGCRAMIMGDAAQVGASFIRDALAAVEIPKDTKIDVVFGGPPCQGMSSAGHQDPGDPRNNLVLEFVRIADELGADLFMMENVPPLITQSKFRPLFKELVRRANAAGFNVTANVLDAANYGVPQRRRRCFVVGTRNGVSSFNFPMPQHWAFGSYADGRAWDQLEHDEATEPTPSDVKAERKARNRAAKKARKRSRR
jgi:site-specific DNA-cytosine methylase